MGFITRDKVNEDPMLFARAKENELTMTVFSSLCNKEILEEALIKTYNIIADSIDEIEIGYIVNLSDDTRYILTVIDEDDEVEAQRNGMKYFYQNFIKQDDDVKKVVTDRIDAIKSVYVFKTEVNNNKERTTALFYSVFNFAREMKAFVLNPAGDLYNSTGGVFYSVERGIVDTEEY